MKNSKVFSQNSRSYGEFYSVIADSYGNSCHAICYGIPIRYIRRLMRRTTKPIFQQKNIRNLEELQKINPDIIGWIRINETNVNYPLLQAEDDDTYMNTDAEGKYSLSGSIFLHCANKPIFPILII